MNIFSCCSESDASFAKKARWRYYLNCRSSLTRLVNSSIQAQGTAPGFFHHLFNAIELPLCPITLRTEQRSSLINVKLGPSESEVIRVI
ncbi:hypothetical protein NPIL_232991 [Nephila pilipes]|uniref:Uncharacterized protein n=1 Tax=Nephila pilipes TaxID=299642 RepID=A0A8X6QDK9_NEPPI|nr:hypothetical protein NPIL_232991 [Nephila pilipes]